MFSVETSTLLATASLLTRSEETIQSPADTMEKPTESTITDTERARTPERQKKTPGTIGRGKHTEQSNTIMGDQSMPDNLDYDAQTPGGGNVPRTKPTPSRPRRPATPGPSQKGAYPVLSRQEAAPKSSSDSFTTPQKQIKPAKHSPTAELGTTNKEQMYRECVKNDILDDKEAAEQAPKPMKTERKTALDGKIDQYLKDLERGNPNSRLRQGQSDSVLSPDGSEAVEKEQVVAEDARGPAGEGPTGLGYPLHLAPRGGTSDEYQIDDGMTAVRVPDPYRFLEDPESAETRAWATAQNALTRKFFEQCESKAKIEEKLA